MTGLQFASWSSAELQSKRVRGEAWNSSTRPHLGNVIFYLALDLHPRVAPRSGLSKHSVQLSKLRRRNTDKSGAVLRSVRSTAHRVTGDNTQAAVAAGLSSAVR